MQDNFRNRRKMAWGSFAVLIFVTFVMCYRLIQGDDPNAWTGIATMVLGCFTAIVGAYAVTATYEKVKSAPTTEKQADN